MNGKQRTALLGGSLFADFDPNGKIFIGGEEFFYFYPLEAQNFIGSP